MTQVDKLEVDGIISRNRWYQTDSEGFQILERDHYPRYLFELMSAGEDDHTPEQWEAGYCDHYDYGMTPAPPSNGARWSDIMADDGRLSNVDKYHERVAERLRERTAEYEARRLAAERKYV